MNLKLTNEVGGSQKLASKSSTASLSRIKEERQRTGRYIAILVGISLFMLAIYHAWVRRIPVVASLVVPALIMFIYVGWVLYTASREKRRNARALLDAEAAMNALTPDEENDLQNNNRDISVSSDSIKTANSPDEGKAETLKIETIKLPMENNRAIRVKPIILINDEPPDDQDLIWPKEVIVLAEKNVIVKNDINKRRFRRRFCRSKKYAAFKRSYSIG